MVTNGLKVTTPPPPTTNTPNWHRRIWWLVIPLALPLVLVGWLFFRDVGFPVDANSALTLYRSDQLNAQFVVSKTARATYPSRFTEVLSAFSVGETARYAVDYPRAIVSALPATPLSDGKIVVPTENGRMPLPYPPISVWCIELENAVTQQTQLVYAALHEDLYNGAWVIHETHDDVSTLLGCQW